MSVDHLVGEFADEKAERKKHLELLCRSITWSANSPTADAEVDKFEAQRVSVDHLVGEFADTEASAPLRRAPTGVGRSLGRRIRRHQSPTGTPRGLHVSVDHLVGEFADELDAAAQRLVFKCRSITWSANSPTADYGDAVYADQVSVDHLVGEFADSPRCKFLQRRELRSCQRA